MGVLATVAATLGACIPGLLVAEFSACAPSWAKRIIRRAARGLPEDERVASEAEWLAHLDDVPGNVSKMIHASQLWRMVLVARINLLNRERLYRAVMVAFLPLMFIGSAASAVIDYARGLPSGYIIVDGIPALSIFTGVTGGIVFFALSEMVERRRTQRLTDPSAQVKK